MVRAYLTYCNHGTDDNTRGTLVYTVLVKNYHCKSCMHVVCLEVSKITGKEDAAQQAFCELE